MDRIIVKFWQALQGNSWWHQSHCQITEPHGKSPRNDPTFTQHPSPQNHEKTTKQWRIQITTFIIDKLHPRINHAIRSKNHRFTSRQSSKANACRSWSTSPKQSLNIDDMCIYEGSATDSDWLDIKNTNKYESIEVSQPRFVRFADSPSRMVKLVLQIRFLKPGNTGSRLLRDRLEREAQENRCCICNQGDKEEVNKQPEDARTRQNRSEDHVLPQPPQYRQVVQPLRRRVCHLLRAVIRRKGRTLQNFAENTREKVWLVNCRKICFTGGTGTAVHPSSQHHPPRRETLKYSNQQRGWAKIGRFRMV